ncbi:TAB2 homolog, chloroplastic [Olea europaea subsp. europaea]|uniref:TAB2 homolog, chloroplastic n=1 Tax=Olea europaea subsp. europaea TaxID=158383 RepID=A0A8S0VEB6_OLEEU|nr:TAB2 homolog, chloroplastic [Olea europaea subsp. europaea]
MASLSFNTTRIKQPITNFTSFTKKIQFNHSFQFSTKKPTNQKIRTSHFPPCFSVSESSVSPSPLETETEEAVFDEEGEDPTAELSYLDPETDPLGITDWEVDFCSRPILDIRGKKIWELVVCDDSLSLQYTKYFPNNVINSVTLKDAMVSICDELGVPLPDKIRFFRSQMQTIISRACKELGIKSIPSKRCLSLLLWLEERYETVYTRHPGFQKGSKPLLALDNPFPMELPENLYGEKWAFVQLPFSAVQEELSYLDTRFGATLDLDLLGIEVDDKTLIPGLAVATSRAKPLAGKFSFICSRVIHVCAHALAWIQHLPRLIFDQRFSFSIKHLGMHCSAWMNGLEVCSIEADVAKASLILSVGISTRYIYATYKKTPDTTVEAEAWEAAKKACGGLHFLAIQDDLDSDDCVGFWLLLDLPPPPV